MHLGRSDTRAPIIHSNNYLRDLVQLRRVIPIFVRTHIQRADGLTKALDKSKYLDWLKMFFT